MDQKTNDEAPSFADQVMEVLKSRLRIKTVSPNHGRVRVTLLDKDGEEKDITWDSCNVILG